MERGKWRGREMERDEWRERERERKRKMKRERWRDMNGEKGSEQEGLFCECHHGMLGRENQSAQ